MISTTQMDYVLAVAREGNFRRAAVSCHVTQPTLSVQIQRLEGFLDTKIFDRNTSPVTPTRLGQQVIDQIKIARSEIEKIREIIANDSDIVEGELRIGVIPTVSPYLVPLFLAPLNQQYPDLELSISELTTENCLEALEKEDIDVAILATRENARKYLQDEIYRE